MRHIAVAMVRRRALEISSNPRESRRYLIVEALTRRVRRTIPPVRNSTCLRGGSRREREGRGDEGEGRE